MTKEKQNDIELQRQASFMIHQMKRGKITRAKITAKLDSLTGKEKESFRRYLNIYKG